jgi:RNA polymerase sigma factor (sigma-70 family)
MVESEFTPRLESIATRWSLIQQAHGAPHTSAVDARRVLVLRYAPAVKSYLRGITRDEFQADELAQDVVVRLLQGDFAGADPERGRFRDLLKTAVRNMARNYWSREKRRAAVDYDPEFLADDSGVADDSWDSGWSHRILELAWDALKRYEREHPDSLAWTTLRLKTEFPDETSEQQAERLSQQAGRPIRADACRQMLRRARIRFAECLVQEVADGLASTSAEQVEEELIALGLYEHVRGVLPQGWQFAARTS